jgi:hypothetical protein
VSYHITTQAYCCLMACSLITVVLQEKRLNAHVTSDPLNEIIHVCIGQSWPARFRGSAQLVGLYFFYTKFKKYL